MRSPDFEADGVKIYCDDSSQIFYREDSPIAPESIDAIITSPPYDDLRDYGGNHFRFVQTAKELVKVVKPGGVIVWIVGDAAKNFSESLSSFKQAIFFVEECGMNLLDTMIYEKMNIAFERFGHRTYPQSFEYMFVFSKGRPKTVNLIHDKANTRSGEVIRATIRKPNGSLVPSHSAGRFIRENGSRGNVWRYPVGKGHSADDIFAHEHPAIFPDHLAADHILSWTNPGETILDPFCGSGTSLKAAKVLGRLAIGIEINRKYCEIAAARVAQGILITP